MSNDVLFSEHWYRVKDLKLRLAFDVDVCRHVYRDVPSYVLHRRSTGAYYRLDGCSFELVGSLDGSRTMGDIWNQAIAAQGDDAPTQSMLLNLLAELHDAQLLSVDRKLNAEQLFARADEQSRKNVVQRYVNPLYMRFALLDPDGLLNRLQPLARFIFSRFSLIGWIALIATALFVLIPRWPTLQHELASFELISPAHAVMFFLVYPLLKLVHEMGHGLALKRYGGEVHEMGIAMMVLLPIPYVDASSAAVLADKRQRMLVGAAGIILELGIAAIATLVWTVSSGPVHELALMLMLIGGLSTLLFNGNPLLKFDGYYLLADALEIPNLESRSRRYVSGIAGALLFGMRKDSIQALDRRESFWLVAYALLSITYRIGLMLTIAFMLSGQFFFFGIALACWIMVTLIGLPVWRFLRFVIAETRLAHARPALITAGLAGLFVSALVWLPVPLNTVTNGVVWLPENAILRTASECVVTELMVEPGQQVNIGERLFNCENTDLRARLQLLQAQVDELMAKRAGLALTNRVKHELLRNDLNTLLAQQQHVQAQVARQTIVASSDGQLTITGTTLLEGRYLQQGEIAAYVVPPVLRTVRVAIAQSDIANLNDTLSDVEIRFAEQGDARRSYVTNVLRQTPKANHRVVSAALTNRGGGELVADPSGDGQLVVEPIFDVELSWPVDAPSVQVGSHVRVKFVHQARPVAGRLLAHIQRAFLARVSS